jgi:hypothetical protein
MTLNQNNTKSFVDLVFKQIPGEPFPRAEEVKATIWDYQAPDFEQILQYNPNATTERTIMDVPFRILTQDQSFTQDNVRHLILNILKSHSLWKWYLNPQETDLNPNWVHMIREMLLHAQAYHQDVYQRDINTLFVQDGFEDLCYEKNNSENNNIITLVHKTDDLKPSEVMQIVELLDTPEAITWLTYDNKEALNWKIDIILWKLEKIDIILWKVDMYKCLDKEETKNLLQKIKNMLQYNIWNIKINTIEDISSFIYMLASKWQTLTPERKTSKQYASDQYHRWFFFKVILAELEARSKLNFVQMEQHISTLRKEFEKKLVWKFRDQFYIERRSKSLDSVITKMLNKRDYSEAEAIKDIFGFRITVFKNKENNDTNQKIQDIIVTSYELLQRSLVKGTELKTKWTYVSLHQNILDKLRQINNDNFQQQSKWNTQAASEYSDVKIVWTLWQHQEQYGIEIQVVDEHHVNEKHYSMHLFLDIKKEIELTCRTWDDHLIRYKHIATKIEEKLHQYNDSYDKKLSYIEAKIKYYTTSPVSNGENVAFWKRIREHMISQYGIRENRSPDSSKWSPYIKIDFTNTQEHKYGSITYKNTQWETYTLDLLHTMVDSRKWNKYSEIINHIADEFINSFDAVVQVRHKKSNISEIIKKEYQKAEILWKQIWKENKKTIEPKDDIAAEQRAHHIIQQYYKTMLKTMEKNAEQNAEQIKTIKAILKTPWLLHILLTESEIEDMQKHRFTYYTTKNIILLLKEFANKDEKSPYIQREYYDSKKNQRKDITDFVSKK